MHSAIKELKFSSQIIIFMGGYYINLKKGVIYSIRPRFLRKIIVIRTTPRVHWKKGFLRPLILITILMTRIGLIV